jgi:hypothetical protein
VNQQKKKKLLVLIISAPVAMVLLVTMFVFSAPYWHVIQWATETNLKFDSNKWKQGYESRILNDGVSPYRHRMVVDLIKNYHLVGKTKRAIIELLGEPSSTGNGQNPVSYYWLTDAYGLDIDPIAGKDLVITYNKKNIVVEVKETDWAN